MEKPITVRQLMLLCKEEIKKGNANKNIMISSDDEGNNFHYLWYSFSQIKDIGEENILINENISKKDNIIILG